MKNSFSIVLPILAGVAIMFFGLPLYGGNLDIFVQKMAFDWEIPVFAMRLLLSVIVALLLVVIFGLLKKIALWVAIVVILGLVFAPAFFKDVPIVSEEVKTFVVEKMTNSKD